MDSEQRQRQVDASGSSSSTEQTPNMQKGANNFDFYPRAQALT